MQKGLYLLSIILLVSCSSGQAIAQTPPKPDSEKNESNRDSIKIVMDSTKTQLQLIVSDSLQKKEVEKEVPIKVQDTTEKNEEKVIPVAKDTIIPNTSFNHKTWDKLLQKHVSIAGSVDYPGFKKNLKTLGIYLHKLSNHPPEKNWTKNDKLAYWLNVYNAYTVKLIVDNYPIKSIKDIKTPWDHRFIKIGDKWYTLNEIEHQILRKMGDPRIHFGINCASYSCPPILNKAFTGKNVDTELDKLATTFINDPERNTITAKQIEISKIFSWFAKDFKTEGTIIDFLNKYSKIKIDPKAHKSFKKYNWDLNE